MTRGFFGVGIYQTKCEANVGMLLRSANLYDAAFVFTVGARYRRTADDTPNVAAHKPLFHYDSINDLLRHLPDRADLVGIELDDRAVALPGYEHPERAVYLLGAEDRGLPEDVLDHCRDVVVIPTARPQSMNVAVAGSTVLYDRYQKAMK